jgi:hypothetical protein
MRTSQLFYLFWTEIFGLYICQYFVDCELNCVTYLFFLSANGKVFKFCPCCILLARLICVLHYTFPVVCVTRSGYPLSSRIVRSFTCHSPVCGLQGDPSWGTAFPARTHRGNALLWRPSQVPLADSSWRLSWKTNIIAFSDKNIPFVPVPASNC